MIPLKVLAETENGVRENVEVEWASNRRRLATVDSRGFLSALLPGEVTITAEVEGIEASIALEVIENTVASVQVEASASVARTGDVIRFTASALDAAGSVVENAPLDYSVSGFAERTDMGASIYEDGAFVAEHPGLYRVTVSAGDRRRPAPG